MLLAEAIKKIGDGTAKIRRSIHTDGSYTYEVFDGTFIHEDYEGCSTERVPLSAEDVVADDWMIEVKTWQR